MRRRIPRSQSEQIRNPDRRDIESMRRNSHLASLGFYPAPLRLQDIPADLRKRMVQEYGGYGGSGEEGILGRILRGVEHIAATQVLSRGLLGRNYDVNTVQTSVARAEKLRGYFFLNPTASVGLTTTVTAQAATTEMVDGNTQANPIGVATFREVHVLVDLSDTDGAATTFTLFLQAFDPLSGNWADAQMLLSTTVVGTYYLSVGAIGVATDIAFRWTVSGGTPSATFSIAAILKDGLAGSANSGLANIIYLGPNGVTSTNGFPLLEGQQQAFYLRENLELFAISDVSGLSLRVFEL